MNVSTWQGGSRSLDAEVAGAEGLTQEGLGARGDG